MKTRRRALLVLAIASLFLLVAPAAGADAAKLSVRHWPQGYFGFVKAPRGCMDGRQVVLYGVEEGAGARGGKRLAGGRSKLLPRGGSGQWSVRAGGSGSVYAVAPKRGRCARIVSRVLASALPRGEVSACSPDVGPVEYCRFDRLHLDLYGASYAPAPCPSLSDTFARCAGYPRVGLYPWGGAGVGAAELEWQSLGGPRDNSRWMKASMFKNNTSEPTFSVVEGLVPSPSSAEFRAGEVWGRKSSDRSRGSGRYFTPDLPGVGPGKVGGPLYINFENGRWGADVHIWGYLFER